MEYDQDTIYLFNRFSPTWFATAGVMRFCEEKSCHWLLDVVASYSAQLKDADYLKVIDLKLGEGSKAFFTVMDEVTGLLVKQEIDFTDLDVDVKWWAVTEGDKTTVLFPSEY